MKSKWLAKLGIIFCKSGIIFVQVGLMKTSDWKKFFLEEILDNQEIEVQDLHLHFLKCK